MLRRNDEDTPGYGWKQEEAPEPLDGAVTAAVPGSMLSAALCTEYAYTRRVPILLLVSICVGNPSFGDYGCRASKAG